MTGFDQMLEPQVLYQGRLWDAPFTDEAMPGDLSGMACSWCEEAIEPEDDAVRLPHIVGHLECHLRFALGDVAHLERRCSCYTSAPDEEIYPQSLRDEARATLHWLLENNRGRYRPT